MRLDRARVAQAPAHLDRDRRHGLHDPATSAVCRGLPRSAVEVDDVQALGPELAHSGHGHRVVGEHRLRVGAALAEAHAAAPAHIHGGNDDHPRRARSRPDGEILEKP